MIPRRLLYLCLLTVCLLPIALAQDPAADFQTASENGARTTVFKTKPGEIFVTLPGDVAVGDTISGTVIVEPKGVNEKEKQRNGRELSGYLVELENRKSAVSSGVIQRVHLSAGIGSPLLILLDTHGKQIDAILIALQPTAPSAPSSLRLATLGQAGRPIEIQGPFDGISANAIVTVGGASARVIAESPRNLVVENPVSAAGPAQIAVTEKGVQTTGEIRIVKINLTAPQTSLLKGQSTELHVQVSGLQGITQPVPLLLQNESPSTVNLAGGETQNIVIAPSQVTTGGVFTSTYALTGVHSGSFNIAASVVTTSGAPAQTLGPPPKTTGTPRLGSQTTTVPQTPSGTQADSSTDQSTAQSTTKSTTSTNSGGVVLTGGTAQDPCKVLKQQLEDAERNCKACKKEQAKLDQAKQAADAARQELDQQTAAFNSAMQKLLDDMRKAIKSDGADTRIALPMEGKGCKGNGQNFVELVLTEGVVICYDNGGIDMDADIGKKATAVLEDWLMGLSPFRQRGQLKKLAAAKAKAEKKNQEALAALAAAQQALDECARENAKRCKDVAQLQQEYDDCVKNAAKQAATDAQHLKDQTAADKLATDQKRATDQANQMTQANEKKAQAEALEKAEAARQATEEQARKYQLCTSCLKFFVEQAINQANANVSQDQKSAIEQLISTLDGINDSLQKGQAAADLIPQLSKLSDLLHNVNAGADAIDKVSKAIDQIKQLAAGGSDPKQLATVLQLASGALDAAAEAIPLLGPLAPYFKTLADAVSAATSAASKLRDIEGLKAGLDEIDRRGCGLLDLYAGSNGDLDRVYDRVFYATDKSVMRETPEIRDQLKQAILAKIPECCRKKLTTECKVLK